MSRKLKGVSLSEWVSDKITYWAVRWQLKSQQQKMQSYDLWQLRHWHWHWQLRTWTHDNLTINCDTGQHLQFLRCFVKHYQIFTLILDIFCQHFGDTYQLEGAGLQNVHFVIYVFVLELYCQKFANICKLDIVFRNFRKFMISLCSMTLHAGPETRQRNLKVLLTNRLDTFTSKKNTKTIK